MKKNGNVIQLVVAQCHTIYFVFRVLSLKVTRRDGTLLFNIYCVYPSFARQERRESVSFELYRQMILISAGELNVYYIIICIVILFGQIDEDSRHSYKLYKFKN